MNEDRPRTEQIESLLHASEKRFRFADAGGIGWFEWNLVTNEWECTPHVAILFGFDPVTPRRFFTEWEPAIFVDDVPKLHSAAAASEETGIYYVEFRVRHSDHSAHCIAGKGEVATRQPGSTPRVAGVFYDITERKQLEARLLALNATLEERVADRVRQLAATNARLEETERRFRLLVDAVNDYAIFMLDTAGNIISWN